jgi:hypothetical protein
VIIRVCLAVALLTPAAAMAQGNPGPYGKLFGRAPAGNGGNRTTVEVRSEFGAQYDNALLPPEDLQADDSPDSGVNGGGTASLSVSHKADRFSANLGGSVMRGQYFTDPSQYGTNTFNANAELRGTITTRFDAEARASYGKSPYYEFFQDFGRGPIALDDGQLPFSPYAVRALDSERIDTSGALITHLTKQSEINLSVYRLQTQFVTEPDNDFLVNGFRAAWQHRLRRDLGVHAAFGREYVDQNAGGLTSYEHEIIDVGLDFNRQFSVARRTTLGFTTSTSIIKDASNDSRFHINGSVNLSKQFRRTWSASLQASRETSFVPGFIEPLLSDTVGASLNGMFTKRLDWSAKASGGRGQYGFSNTSGFNTVAATTRLSFALGRHVSVFGQYYLYQYEVPPNAMTLDVPGHLARQVGSIGVSLYVPLYEKVRHQ